MSGKRGQTVVVFEGRRAFTFPSLESASLYLTARGMLPRDKIEKMLSDREPLINGRQVAYPSSVEKTAGVIKMADSGSAKQRHTIQGLVKLLTGGALAAGGARLGGPAMRGLVRVGERTANGKFLNGTRLGRLLKPFTRSAVYGDDIARMAREKGIANVVEGSTMNSVKFRSEEEARRLAGTIRNFFEDHPKLKNSKVGKYLSKRLTEGKLKKLFIGDLTSNQSNPNKVNAHLFEAFNGGKPSRSASTHVGATANLDALSKLDDKKMQALLFEQAGLHGRMPTTIDDKILDRVAERISKKQFEVSYADVKKALMDEINSLPNEERAYYLGTARKAKPSDFHWKAIGDTAGSSPPTTVRDKDRWFVNLRGGEKAERRQLAREELSNYLFQTTKPTIKRRNSNIVKTKIGKMFDDKLPVKPDFGAGKHGVEYRVHVVNGKPIVMGTSSKWNPADYLNPFTTREKARLEKQIGKDFEKLMALDTPEARAVDLKHQVLGMDVGIAPDGSPIYYELNPSMPGTMHSGSGQLMQPWIRHAVTSAIKGEMPITQKIQLAAAGVPTVLGAGTAASGYNDLMKRGSDNRVGNAIAGTVGGTALGGTGAAMYGTERGGSILDDLREAIYSAVAKNGNIKKKPSIPKIELAEGAGRVDRMKTFLKNAIIASRNAAPDKRVLSEFGTQFLRNAGKSLRANRKPIGIAAATGATLLGTLGAMSGNRK